MMENKSQNRQSHVIEKLKALFHEGLVLLDELEPSSLSVTEIIANQPLSSKQPHLAHVPIEEYDVVLDIPNTTLRTRLNPGQHSPLEERELIHLGSFRLRLLIYMLEKRNARICADNIHLVYGPSSSMEPGTLAKTIQIFRNVLQPQIRPSSYILTETAWGESLSKSGCVYTMNTQWKHLVLR